MDDAERAQAEEIALWQVNQINSRMAQYQPGEPGYGPARCRDSDCEEPISDMRRAMGKKYCIDCTNEQERLKKLGR